jgi:hypothetical protein
MTIREQIHARLAKMDDAVLPEVLRELDFLEERHKRDFPQDFLELLQTPKDNSLSGEEALRIATEAVNADRQKPHR